MTPIKEIFIKVKERLETIPNIELIDLNRNQFGQEEEHYPNCYTCVLIRIPQIDYDKMVENNKQGLATFELELWVKDGFLDQHNGTADTDHGLIEIDLIDNITNALELLQGETFKPVELISVGPNEIEAMGLISFKLIYETQIYNRVNYGYDRKNLTITT